MSNNSDSSDARSPTAEIERLTARVAALEESNVIMTFQFLRARTNRRRWKKSFNRLAGRYLRLKEKYSVVLAERNRLAGENNWEFLGFFFLFLSGPRSPSLCTHLFFINEKISFANKWPIFTALIVFWDLIIKFECVLNDNVMNLLPPIVVDPVRSFFTRWIPLPICFPI